MVRLWISTYNLYAKLLGISVLFCSLFLAHCWCTAIKKAEWDRMVRVSEKEQKQERENWKKKRTRVFTRAQQGDSRYVKKYFFGALKTCVSLHLSSLQGFHSWVYSLGTWFLFELVLLVCHGRKKCDLVKGIFPSFFVHFFQSQRMKAEKWTKRTRN